MPWKAVRWCASTVTENPLPRCVRKWASARALSNGIAAPNAVGHLVGRLREVVGDAEIVYHGHNALAEELPTYFERDLVRLVLGDALALRYVIVRGPVTAGFTPLLTGPDYWVWESPKALPRVYVPRRVEVVRDRGELVAVVDRHLEHIGPV